MRRSGSFIGHLSDWRFGHGTVGWGRLQVRVWRRRTSVSCERLGFLAQCQAVSTKCLLVTVPPTAERRRVLCPVRCADGAECSN